MLLSEIVSMVEPALTAATPRAASELFFSVLAPLGPSYLQTRLYRRPTERLTSERHWAAGGIIARLAPAEWPRSSAFEYICFECNPLLGAIRENRTSYRFSDFAPRSDRRYGAYWEAMSEARIGEALCATSYGPGGAIASLHLGFAGAGLSAEQAQAVQLAGLLLTERIMMLDVPPPADRVALTPRESDCLSYVAEGKTDWEISVILGIAEATARFHIDNGRRKLGAVNRSQAVARLVNQRLI